MLNYVWFAGCLWRSFHYIQSMLKHHQLIKQTTRGSVIFQVLIVHVGDFSCIKKHTVEVKGAEGKCIFLDPQG